MKWIKRVEKYLREVDEQESKLGEVAKLGQLEMLQLHSSSCRKSM